MTRSKDDMRAALTGEAAVTGTTPGGLDGVFTMLAQLMERSEERHREATERILEATVKVTAEAEERHRQAVEKAEERHSEMAVKQVQEIKRSSELTLDLFKKISTRLDERCDLLEQRMMPAEAAAAAAAPGTMLEKVARDLVEVATSALRKYVNGG